MDDNNGVQFAVGLGVGVVIGVVATVLLTPQAGGQTRKQLKETTLNGRDTVVSRLIDVLV